MKLALEKRDLISLAVGFTDNETLPVAETSELIDRVLRKPQSARAALQYGTTQGLPSLRQELLRWWRQQDGFHAGGVSRLITADDFLVTNGSQQLLYLVSEVLCDPGDIVLVEDPTYFVYLGIVEAMGVRTFGFDSLAVLKSRFQFMKSHGLLPRLKLLYLVTYFQNPTGRTWSLEEKREAMRVVKHYERAAGHPIYILEDAAYRDLRFEGEDAPSFKSIDPGNKRVLYTNTLTKPFATGLKVGYGILPPAVMRSVLRAKGNHDFGTSNFAQTILARALAEGFYQQHVRKIAAAYRRKRDAMVEELRASFPSTARYEIPRGGLYVWVELSSRVKTGATSRLFRRAREAGVLYVPGEMCHCHDPTRRIPTNGMRLSFGAVPIAQIRRGVRLLADVIRQSG